MPEEYEGTPCLDLVTGSPSTLLIHRAVASCPPPLEGQAGIFQPRSSFPGKARHQGSAPVRRHKESLADCRTASIAQ